MSKYEVGDIVFVSEYVYPNGKKGDNHFFVIIDDDDKLVPAEYFGLLSSSNVSKSKECSDFLYNEPIAKNNTNNLKTDSIVKCDVLYNIPAENICYKLGSVDVDDYIRFMESYNKAILDQLRVTE